MNTSNWVDYKYMYHLVAAGLFDSTDTFVEGFTGRLLALTKVRGPS